MKRYLPLTNWICLRCGRITDGVKNRPDDCCDDHLAFRLRVERLTQTDRAAQIRRAKEPIR